MNTIHVILGYDAQTMKEHGHKIRYDLGVDHFLYTFPESELHPSTHGAMAESFASMFEPVVVVTHSEIIVLRLRRMVAEGRLSPEQITITWVGAKGDAHMKITVDSEGEVSDWPEGVFSEDFKEVTAIRRAQRHSEDPSAEPASPVTTS
jgi:hypothetical protein